MDDVTTWLLGLAVVIVIFYLWYRRHDPRLPPCPTPPWPIVGHLFLMAADYRSQFKKWRKQSGDIYSIYMGQTLTVVLSSYDILKEVLLKKGEGFSDRPFLFFDLTSGMLGKGVVFSSGNIWKEHREVTLSIFKYLGMGKNSIAKKVQEEIDFFIEALAQLKGEPTDIDLMVATSTANVACCIINGERFEYSDPNFENLAKSERDLVALAGGTALLNFFPFLQYLPFDPFNSKAIIANNQNILNNFVKRFVQKKGYDEYDEHNLDNFIACYVNELKKKRKSGERTQMDEENLLKMVLDLFGAGLETTACVLLWGVAYLANFPDVQEKAFREIEKKVGLERHLTMQDRTALTYVNAVIHETMRVSSVVPLSVPHKCVKDTIIRGFLIPKDTQIIPNLDGVMYEKEVWGEDVYAYRPERFIGENGLLKIPDEFIPFGIGKRVCAGESLATMELFLVLSSIIQRFKVRPEFADKPVSLKATLGFSARPLPFKIRLLDRKEILKKGSN